MLVYTSNSRVAVCMMEAVEQRRVGKWRGSCVLGIVVFSLFAHQFVVVVAFTTNFGEFDCRV